MAKSRKKTKPVVHKFTLRIDEDVFKSVKDNADYLSLSINQYIIKALKDKDNSLISNQIW